MKIAIVAYKFGTEQEIGEHLGTYHYFIETLRRMVRAGHKVTVIAPWLSFFQKGSTDVNGVKVIRYYPPLFNRPKLGIINSILRSWYISVTGKRVLELDRREKPDVICVWQARETGYAVARIADKLRAPFVFRQITAWQWHFERMKLGRAPQEKFAREIYAKARQIIFVSRAAAEAERALGIDDNKIRTMGVAIETDLFKPREHSKSGKDILFIGRINFAEKGIGVLLDAMPLVLREISDAKLTIIGGHAERDLIRAKRGADDSDKMISDIKKLGIESSITLAGKQPFEKLPEYLNSSDVMVVPSLWIEAFGQVTIEAMASGVPVVTSDIGGSTEINVDGETGFIVLKGDPKALAGGILRILKDRELRTRMGQAARKRVEENYSYEILTSKFIELLTEAADG